MSTEAKLDPEFKKKWVEALRSGGYKKGTQHLYNASHNSYCCLGVACYLASGYAPRTSFIPTDLTLVPEVPEILRGAGGIPGMLARMNDGLNESGEAIVPKSFSEIADYIEQNL